MKLLKPICEISDREGAATDCYGSMCYNLLDKLRVGLYKAENGQGNWFQKVESRLDVWAAHRHPTCSIFGTVKISPGLV